MKNIKDILHQHKLIHLTDHLQAMIEAGLIREDQIDQWLEAYKEALKNTSVDDGSPRGYLE